MRIATSIALKEELKSVSIGPLLRDFAEQDRLEGKRRHRARRHDRGRDA